MRGRELETESVCWLKHKDMGMECAWERVDRISVRREWVKRETDGWERRWREGRKREMWVFSLVMRETYKRARGIRNKWEREAESRREFDGMLREDGLEKEREKGEAQERHWRRTLIESPNERKETEFVLTWEEWERAERLLWDGRETERRDIELLKGLERVEEMLERA